MADTDAAPMKLHLSKNGKVIAGVAGLAAIFILYRYWKASRATASTTDTSATSPPVDTFAGASGQALPPYDAYGNPIQYDAYGQPVYQTTSTAPQNSQQWTQSAITYLTGLLGYDPQTVAQAISNYITGANGGHLTQAQADIVNLARAYLGPVPTTDIPVQITPVAPPSTTTTSTSSYVGAQWAAGQHVVIGGTPGVADTWEVLAKKILSSNTYNNPANINRAVQELKKANPSLAKKYPTAVPNTNALIIPTIHGLNAPK